MGSFCDSFSYFNVRVNLFVWKMTEPSWIDNQMLKYEKFSNYQKRYALNIVEYYDIL